MLKIEAIIRSTRFHDVKHSLNNIGIQTFSAYDVKLTGLHIEHVGGGGRPGGFKASDLIAKTNIVVICHERQKDQIINAITKASKTGRQGDGLISVYKIDNLIKIRNGATEEAALK